MSCISKCGNELESYTARLDEKLLLDKKKQNVFMLTEALKEVEQKSCIPNRTLSPRVIYHK